MKFRCDFCGKWSLVLKKFETPDERLWLCTRCHTIETLVEQAKQAGDAAREFREELQER